MKIFKNIILFLLPISLIVVQSCDFNLDSILDNTDKTEEETTVVCRYEWDANSDINYYYEDDLLIWKEAYDFDSTGKCIFKTRLSPTDTTLWSYVYEWDGDNVVASAYFDITNELASFDNIIYSGNLVTSHLSYNSSSELLWVKNYTYDLDNNLIQTISLDGELNTNWIYTSTFSGEDLIDSSYYENSGDRVGYIVYELDSNDRNYITTGYGVAKTSDKYISNPKGFSFKATGGINTVVRNSLALAIPESPEVPTMAETTINTNTLPYSWKKMWEYDDFGSSYVVLDSDYLPTHMERYAPDYLEDLPIVIDISYAADNKILSKTTTYNGSKLLKLEFDYDDDGYPTQIDSTGSVLPLPLTYKFNFNPTNGSEIGIAIYSQSTMLQKFVYEFKDGVNIEDLVTTDFSENIASIKNYNGNQDALGNYELVGTYYFSYEKNSETDQYNLIITAKDKTETSTGQIIIVYDNNYNTASITSYKADGGTVWKYSYSYDDLNNRISEAKVDSDDIPELITGFDIETLFEDVKRYLPIKVPNII